MLPQEIGPQVEDELFARPSAGNDSLQFFQFHSDYVKVQFARAHTSSRLPSVGNTAILRLHRRFADDVQRKTPTLLVEI